MAEFNISELFQKAFGYQMPEKFEIAKSTDRTEQGIKGGQFFKDDLYGRQMFMPVTVKGFLLPFAVISISSKKTIIETALVERAGTIKEIISADDFTINVKGLLIRPDNNFPDSEVIDLHELFKLDESMVMDCVLTNIFLTGDHKVVLKSLNFPAIAGVQNARPYEMDFVSDDDYKLEM